jgi:hypothetical protein
VIVVMILDSSRTDDGRDNRKCGDAEHLEYLCHQSSLPDRTDGRFASVIPGWQVTADGMQAPATACSCDD